MNKIKAIVVDDEQWARIVLTNLLKLEGSFDVIAQCEDVLSAVEQIKQQKPDVVFLDIEMPNYAGYELVNFFKKIDFYIVFVTAFDKYAIKAFEINAIDYLIKPIEREKLSQAIAKIKNKLYAKNTIEDYNNLLKSIKDNKFNKIILPELGNRHIVELQNIIAIKADTAYSILYLTNNKPITISKSLKYFEDILKENTCFFRSHRSWIINLKHLDRFNKTENTILLKGDIKTQLSRSKFNEFEQVIKCH